MRHVAVVVDHILQGVGAFRAVVVYRVVVEYRRALWLQAQLI
jgi:hypothetical protein